MKAKKGIDVLVGSNIQRERRKAGYTQEKFSELIGVETKSLSAIERGVFGASLTTLMRICEVLNISINILLFEESPGNDVRSLTEQLERLTPEQFEIARVIITKMIEGFSLNRHN